MKLIVTTVYDNMTDKMVVDMVKHLSRNARGVPQFKNVTIDNLNGLGVKSKDPDSPASATTTFKLEK